LVYNEKKKRERITNLHSEKKMKENDTTVVQNVMLMVRSRLRKIDEARPFSFKRRVKKMQFT
jgi:hypothetical protein